jgi:hypothetical protein
MTKARKKKFRRLYERKDDHPSRSRRLNMADCKKAYDHFNAALFDGKLPDCFLTYQRRANSDGYFSPDRFSGRVAKLARHELALNPDGFIGRSDQQIV